MVEMEIDDGGEAARQFASDEENENFVENVDSESEDQASDPESGEITPTQIIEENNASELRKSQPVIASTSAPDKMGKNRRDSVEDRLDTMSSTLLAMKEIMERNGMLNTPNHEAKNKEKGEKIDNEQIPSSLSETTIYQNALQRDIQMNSVVSRPSEINKNFRERDTREV